MSKEIITIGPEQGIKKLYQTLCDIMQKGERDTLCFSSSVHYFFRKDIQPNKFLEYKSIENLR